MSIIEELRRTPKGQLKYDRQGLSMQSIEGVLDEIQSEMDSMQVRLSSPPAFSSRPSFGLSCDAEPGTPLLVRTVRIASPAVADRAGSETVPKSIQVTVRNRTAESSRGTGAGKVAKEKPVSPPLMKITVDLTTPVRGQRVVDVASARPTMPASSTPTKSAQTSPFGPWTSSPKTPRSSMKPWPPLPSFSNVEKRATPIGSRTIDLTTPPHGQQRDNATIDLVTPQSYVTRNRTQSSTRHSSGGSASVPQPLGTASPSGEAVLEQVGLIASSRSVEEMCPFTPRTHDKLLHEERQRHHAEAKEQGLARLAAAEATLQELRMQHQLQLQQLAAEQLLRGQEERQRRGAQRQLSERQLQQTTERIEEDRQRRAKDLSEQVQARLQRQQAAEQEVRQRAADQRRLLDQLVAAQKQLRTVIAHVVTRIKACVDRAQLQASPAAAKVEELKRLMTRMDGLVTSTPTEARVAEAEKLAREAVGLTEQLAQQIDSINASAAAVSAPEAKPAAPAAAVKPSPAPAASATSAPAAAAAAEPQIPGELVASLEESRLRHENLQQKLAQFRAGFNDILTDPRWKQFKFDCQKAVNTPINAISPVSSAHLKDKLEKLRSLLRGQQVTVAGQQQVSASAHPRGVQFCLDLVAKKFVRQGEDVVSSKPEAAFALAAVLAALQREFPDLADLTAAHLLATCPYLAPFYPAQVAGESNESYYRKLGYDYSDGVVERQDKFLKRMSGVARLYAALLVSRPPQGTPAAPAGSPAPAALTHAWRWLSAVSNLEPRADITASLLYDVLEVTGSALAAAYGAQFFKLARLLHARYLPVLQQVTPEGCGGPVVRLEQRLQHVVKTGRVPPPPGQLKLYGW